MCCVSAPAAPKKEPQMRRAKLLTRLGYHALKIPMPRFARRDHTTGNDIVRSIKDELKR